MAQAAGAATGETIHTTANHPWLTTDRGWVLAGDLHAGELVRTLDGQIAIVAWVHTVPGQADYYNLTASVLHAYAVGALPYLTGRHTRVILYLSVHKEVGYVPGGAGTIEYRAGAAKRRAQATGARRHDADLLA